MNIYHLWHPTEEYFGEYVIVAPNEDDARAMAASSTEFEHQKKRASTAKVDLLGISVGVEPKIVVYAEYNDGY